MSDFTDDVAVEPVVCNQPTHISLERYQEDCSSQYRAGTNMALSATRNTLLTHFRTAVSEGSIDRDSATELFNNIASELCFGEVETIGGIYTVTIKHNGYEVFQVADVEADSDEDAVDTVRDNLEISTNVSISYGYDSEEFEIDSDILYDLEIEATEQ